MLERKHLPVLSDQLSQLIVEPSTIRESNKERSSVVQVGVVNLDRDVTEVIVSLGLQLHKDAELTDTTEIKVSTIQIESIKATHRHDAGREPLQEDCTLEHE